METDMPLVTEALESPALQSQPDIPPPKRRRKPWALPPNVLYRDSRGTEYVTADDGSLRRLTPKPLSKKARRRRAG